MVRSTKKQSTPTSPAGSFPGRSLGVKGDDRQELIKRIREGFRFSKVKKFQQAAGMSIEEIGRFAQISKQTLNRRKDQGRLQSDESERLLRLASIFDMAVDLFEGDVQQARRWLMTPQHGLGGESPLQFATTEVGAREVEYLIGRLEHGVLP